MAKYPVSMACPKCQGVRYKKEKPEALVAFVPDRVCEACGTRYTPPTPRWAGGLIMLCGVGMLGFGALIVVDHIRNKDISKDFPHLPVFMCGVPGFAALGYGLKHLVGPEKPVDRHV
jgi:hypothetical protein